MVRPLTDDELSAWRAFLRAHAAVIDALNRELENERGMSIAEFDVLATLSAAGGRLRMGELADAVLLSRSGVTRLVDRMVAAGLLRRERCPSDRRGSFAVLTAAGRQALRDAGPVHARGVAEHFARFLSPEDARRIAEVFEKVAPRGLGC